MARPQKPGTPPPGSETTVDATARSHGAHAQTGTWWKLPEATNWGDRAKIRGFCSKGNVRVATPGDFRVTGHSGQASDPRSARLWAEAWERRPRRCHQSERRGLPGGGRSPLRAAGRTCPPSTRAAARGPPSAATDRPGSRTAGDAPSSRPLLRRPRLSCSSGNVPPRCPSPTLNLFSPKPTSEWLSLKSPAS